MVARAECPLGHHGQALGAIVQIGEGLCGDGARAGLCPRDDRCRGQELALYRYTPFLAVGIVGHDRKGGDWKPLAVLSGFGLSGCMKRPARDALSGSMVGCSISVTG